MRDQDAGLLPLPLRVIAPARRLAMAAEETAEAREWQARLRAAAEDAAERRAMVARHEHMVEAATGHTVAELAEAAQLSAEARGAAARRELLVAAGLAELGSVETPERLTADGGPAGPPPAAPLSRAGLEAQWQHHLAAERAHPLTVAAIKMISRSMLAADPGLDEVSIEQAGQVWVTGRDDLAGPAAGRSARARRVITRTTGDAGFRVVDAGDW